MLSCHTDFDKTRRASWALRLTQQEIEQLQREADHLELKSGERALTQWETVRRNSVFHDLSRLLDRARKLTDLTQVF
ncbi:MAG: hypothetical protein KDD60_09925 [Bdellovibrionales bacterium]|nr:hypothetical protein [Bdellovibrionales bacterium]